MAFVTDHQASEAVQPVNRAFDLSAITVRLQCVFVLRGRLRAVLAVRTDQFDEPILQPSTQRVAVSRLVVQQVSRGPEGHANHRTIEQRIDQVDFAFIGSGDVTRQRNVMGIGQQQQCGPFTSAVDADTVTPFSRARTSRPPAGGSSPVCRSLHRERGVVPTPVPTSFFGANRETAASKLHMRETRLVAYSCLSGIRVPLVSRRCNSTGRTVPG